MEQRNEQAAGRTEISSLGEFGLIDRLAEQIVIKHRETIKGIGDDAAVVRVPDGELQLISKDLLIEGVHFDLTYCPLMHLGYKAMAVNFSDIAAMNALPKQVLVGIAISNRFSVEAVQEIYAGMKLACDRYEVDLIGGDTTSSASGMCISVTVLGSAPEDKICYRNGAKENDLLCVSGDLGSAYAGLLLLEKEKRAFMADPNYKPDFSDYSYVLERQLKPEPRVDVVKKLAELGVKPSSMIDVSDGLASEILHLSKQSACGCMLYEDKIPLDEQSCKVFEEFSILPSVAALSGGEDYELLFTVAQSDYEKIKNCAEFCVIGYMTDAASGNYLVPENGSLIPLTAQGWDSFGEERK